MTVNRAGPNAMEPLTARDIEHLIKLYKEVDETLDELGGGPPAFLMLWRNFIVDRRRKDVDPSDLYAALMRLRKTGSLPRKKRPMRKSKGERS